jgi:hypothetical protein
MFLVTPINGITAFEQRLILILQLIVGKVKSESGDGSLTHFKEKKILLKLICNLNRS